MATIARYRIAAEATRKEYAGFIRYLTVTNPPKKFLDGRGRRQGKDWDEFVRGVAGMVENPSRGYEDLLGEYENEWIAYLQEHGVPVLAIDRVDWSMHADAHIIYAYALHGTEEGKLVHGVVLRLDAETTKNKPDDILFKYNHGMLPMRGSVDLIDWSISSSWAITNPIENTRVTLDGIARDFYVDNKTLFNLPAPCPPKKITRDVNIGIYTAQGEELERIANDFYGLRRMGSEETDVEFRERCLSVAWTGTLPVSGISMIVVPTGNFMAPQLIKNESGKTVGYATREHEPQPPPGLAEYMKHCKYVSYRVNTMTNSFEFFDEYGEKVGWVESYYPKAWLRCGTRHTD